MSVSAPSNCNCYDEQACLRTNGVCHDRIWHGDETEVQAKSEQIIEYVLIPSLNLGRLEKLPFGEWIQNIVMRPKVTVKL